LTAAPTWSASTSTPAMGGATRTVEVAEEDRAGLKAKLPAFLRDRPAGFAESRPDDGQLRQLMEALRNERLSDKDFAYRRDIPAFDDYPRAAQWTDGRPPLPFGFRVAVIGAGLSGIAMAVQLENLGIPYVIYERRARVGGTWEINKYPDVRVDVISVVYQYSFEKKYPWSEYFAQGAEVRDYVEHVARKHGVIPHVQFGHEVTAATFDEASGTWSLDVSAGGRAERHTVNAVVAATGLFAVPKRFEAPGLSDFKGTVVHSTEWTGSEQYAGRNVAIIGNGSTGVQMLKPVRQQARQVYVIHQRGTGHADRRRAKNYYLNSFGRNQVSMPWRVEESYSYFERFEPGDYTFR
jgi:4-hydroxyacetophenone monooxygenase